jgi:hypothetical protein
MDVYSRDEYSGLLSGAAADDAALVRQVRQCLAHLHDPAYLQIHPLASRLPREHDGTPRGFALFGALSDTIDSLEVGAEIGDSVTPPSCHRILALRYVQQLDASTIQRRLGLSRSAYYRAEGRAIEAVASALRARWEGMGRSSSANLVADQTRWRGVLSRDRVLARA